MESTAGAPIANTKDDIKDVVMGPGGDAMTGSKATRKRRQRRRKTTMSASGNTEDNATTVVEKEKEKETEPVVNVVNKFGLIFKSLTSAIRELAMTPFFYVAEGGVTCLSVSPCHFFNLV